MLTTSGRRPLRTLLLVTVAAGAVIAYRNAVAEKGGSYDPAAPGTH